MKIKFYRYALKHKRLYLIAFAGLIIATIFSLLGPFLMGRLVDSVIGEDKKDLFWPFAILMFLSYCLTGVFHYIEEYHSDQLSKAIASDTRRDVFSWIQKQDGNFFRRRSAADLMSRTTTDSNNIGFAFGFCGIYTLEILSTIVAMTIAIFIVNPIGAIVPIFFIPLIVVLAYIAEAKGDKVMDEISDETANINQVSSEAIRGIRTVKSFNQEDLERRKFSRHNKRFWYLNNKLDCIWADWYSPVEAISRSMALFNILFCGALVIGERLSLGDFTTIFQYTSQLALPIMDLGWLLRTIAQARSGERKINAIMAEEPLIKDGSGSLKKACSLEFRDVGLVLDGHRLLHDISFFVEEGKCVAIMGATGSGKSLLASLAVRFLDPTEGGVYIDGENIKNVPLKEVRSFSTIVTQDIFLFSDSVLDNIRLGQRTTLSLEDCKESASRAKASEFIEKLSQGYDTVIGERGVGLSGGQRQRLSIARAFSRHTKLLILDDATSALDMETEREIETTLREEKDKALLIIAHRISAVAFADEILFLENGAIAERGTHSELLARKGLYYKTYISQYPEVR